jgi:hypothetical protein
MYAPETHYNPLGSWYVDVIEVTPEGNTIIDTQNFETAQQAQAFSTMIMRGAFYCEYCESFQPEQDMVGDDDPMCQNCYQGAVDRAHDGMKEAA